MAKRYSVTDPINPSSAGCRIRLRMIPTEDGYRCESVGTDVMGNTLYRSEYTTAHGSGETAEDAVRDYYRSLKRLLHESMSGPV